jgi:hypothetical protein
MLYEYKINRNHYYFILLLKMQQQDTSEMENFKILRSIWKNNYDKILEIKVTNRRSWNEMKTEILEEEKKKIDAKYDKDYNEQYILNKMYNIILI